MGKRRCLNGAGKRRFPDHKSATRALRSLSKRSERDKVPVRVYECHLCKGWHLTSEPLRDSQ